MKKESVIVNPLVIKDKQSFTMLNLIKRNSEQDHINQKKFSPLGAPRLNIMTDNPQNPYASPHTISKQRRTW